MTMKIMIVAWVAGSVLILQTNFMLEDGAERKSRARASGVDDTKVALVGDSWQEEGSAGTIGLGTIF